ncbi:MAG: phage protein Gp36 family protein [Neptuniibacter sp.]
MYATVQEMTLQYGLNEIAQLLDDEEGNISSELLQAELDGDASSFTAEEQAAITRALNRADQIIQQQMNFIDSRISRYPVPLNDSKARTTPVHTCCMALARAALADDGTNLSEQVSKDRDFWRTWLRDIASGKAVLPGLTPISLGSGTQQQRLSGEVKSSVDWGAY